MDPNLNDMYQEDAVACSNATLLENGNVTVTEQLEPDILLSIKKEDLVCPCNLHVSFCTPLQILQVYFLHCGRSRVRFPMVSLEFFSDIILLVAL
jgi:hypothetical protein